MTMSKEYKSEWKAAKIFCEATREFLNSHNSNRAADAFGALGFGIGSAIGLAIKTQPLNGADARAVIMQIIKISATEALRFAEEEKLSISTEKQLSEG